MKINVLSSYLSEKTAIGILVYLLHKATQHRVLLEEWHHTVSITNIENHFLVSINIVMKLF